MAKTIGKICFLLVSTAILVTVLTFAWRDSNKPEVEVEPNFSITETTEEKTTEEETLDAGVVETSETATTEFEYVDTPDNTQVNTQDTTQETIQDTTQSTVPEATTERYIETVVWVEVESEKAGDS